MFFQKNFEKRHFYSWQVLKNNGMIAMLSHSAVSESGRGTPGKAILFPVLYIVVYKREKGKVRRYG